MSPSIVFMDEIDAVSTKDTIHNPAVNVKFSARC